MVNEDEVAPIARLAVELGCRLGIYANNLALLVGAMKLEEIRDAAVQLTFLSKNGWYLIVLCPLVWIRLSLNYSTISIHYVFLFFCILPTSIIFPCSASSPLSLPTIGDKGGGLRVLLGALIQGVSAMANLHNALICSGEAYSMPTRGPISIFSGFGPSKISKPPGHIHYKLYQHHIKSSHIVWGKMVR